MWEGSAPPRLGPPEMMLADGEKREIEGERVGGGGSIEREREKEMKWKGGGMNLYIYFRENYNKLPHYLFLIIF